MTTTPIHSLTRSDQQNSPKSTGGWACAGALLVLFALFYQSYLSRMFRIATKAEGETVYERLIDIAMTPWNHDWSHAVVIPLISAYFIYNNWGQISQISTRVYRPGLAVVLFGMFSFVWWIYPGRNDMFQGYSMIIALFGLALFLLGPGAMRSLWFPILYLALGIKIADRIWESIAWKLQLIAAKSATVALQLVGIDASVDGSTISLVFMNKGHWTSEALNVAEACSGLRMLMAFVALGLAMAYLTTRKWWQRAIIFALTVPIAVLVNVGRVTVLGILYLFDKQFATGDIHTFIGMLMLIPAGLLFLGIGWVLDRIVISSEPAAGATDDESAPGNPSQDHPTGSPGTIPDWRWNRTGLGFVLGAVMIALAGVSYAALLAALRPDVFEIGMTRPVMLGGLAVAVAMLGACVIYMWRALRPETTIDAGPREVSLGMAVGVFAAATLGLNAIINATQTVLVKHAVPLRAPLYQLPEQLGEWTMVKEDEPLGAEGVEALGTDKYITRIYQAPPTTDAASPMHVRLHIAYYTGTPDTVPHVPDRCFVAGGLTPIDVEQTTVRLAGPQYRQENGRWLAGSKIEPAGVVIPETEFAATIFTYARPEQPENQSNVLYYFAANGKFLSTPELVRLQGFDPRDRYSYYCKIEVGVIGTNSRESATHTASMFLSAALPEIMACLPDWDRLGQEPTVATAKTVDEIH